MKYVYTIKDVIKTKVNGLDYTYYKVNMDQKNVRNGDMQFNAEYLIDLKGKYLNFNMFEIFEFRSENEDEAKNLDKNNKFFLNAGIDLNNKLPDEIFTKEVDSINYELTGDGYTIYNGGLQKVTKISNDKYLVEVGSPQLLEKVSDDDVNFYLKSSSRYPSSSNKIINFTKKVINNEKSDELKIEKLMNFVSEYIEDDYESNSESVFDIIDKKRVIVQSILYFSQQWQDQLDCLQEKLLDGLMMVIKNMFFMHGSRLPWMLIMFFIGFQ